MAKPVTENVKKLLTYANLLGVTYNDLYSVASIMRHEEKRQQDTARLADLMKGVDWEILNRNHYRLSNSYLTIEIEYDIVNKYAYPRIYEYTVYQLIDGKKKYMHSNTLRDDSINIVPLKIVPKRDRLLLASFVIFEHVCKFRVNTV